MSDNYLRVGSEKSKNETCCCVNMYSGFKFLAYFHAMIGILGIIFSTILIGWDCRELIVHPPRFLNCEDRLCGQKYYLLAFLTIIELWFIYASFASIRWIRSDSEKTRKGLRNFFAFSTFLCLWLFCIFYVLDFYLLSMALLISGFIYCYCAFECAQFAGLFDQ